MMMDSALKPNMVILLHLESMKKKGPVYDKTARGTSAATGMSEVNVQRILLQLKTDGMISASKPTIIGKCPPICWHHPPFVFEITEEGTRAIDEVRDVLGLKP